MTKISFALIVMGIVMCVVMSDATAAVLCITLGLYIYMYNALAAWRKDTKCGNVNIINFVDRILAEE